MSSLMLKKMKNGVDHREGMTLLDMESSEDEFSAASPSNKPTRRRNDCCCSKQCTFTLISFLILLTALVGLAYGYYQLKLDVDLLKSKIEPTPSDGSTNPAHPQLKTTTECSASQKFCLSFITSSADVENFFQGVWDLDQDGLLTKDEVEKAGLLCHGPKNQLKDLDGDQKYSVDEMRASFGFDNTVSQDLEAQKGLASRVQSLESSVQSLNDKIKSLEDKENEAQPVTGQQTLGDVAKAAADIGSSVETLTGRVAALEELVAGLSASTTPSSVKKDLSASDDTTSLKLSVDVLQQDIQTVNNSLRSQVDALDQKTSNLALTVAELQHSTGTLGNQLQLLMLVAADKNQSNDDSNPPVDTSVIVSQVLEKLQNLTSDEFQLVGVLNSRADNLTHWAEALSAQLGTYDTRLSGLNDDVINLQGQWQTLQNTVDTLSSAAAVQPKSSPDQEDPPTTMSSTQTPSSSNPQASTKNIWEAPLAASASTTRPFSNSVKSQAAFDQTNDDSGTLSLNSLTDTNDLRQKIGSPGNGQFGMIGSPGNGQFGNTPQGNGGQPVDRNSWNNAPVYNQESLNTGVGGGNVAKGNNLDHMGNGQFGNTPQGNGDQPGDGNSWNNAPLDNQKNLNTGVGGDNVAKGNNLDHVGNTNFDNYGAHDYDMTTEVIDIVDNNMPLGNGPQQYPRPDQSGANTGEGFVQNVPSGEEHSEEVAYDPSYDRDSNYGNSYSNNWDYEGQRQNPSGLNNNPPNAADDFADNVREGPART